MAKVYAYLANGMEEVECLAVVDILRRGGVEVETVAIEKNPLVVGAHDIMIAADGIWGGIPEDATMVFLPGGKVGTDNLRSHTELCHELKEAAKRGVKLAAICAAPSVLGGLGLLTGKKATCYPGFEGKLAGAQYTGEGVVVDGNVITGKGLGYAIDMGLAMLKMLTSEDIAQHVKESIMHPDCQ